MSQPGRLLGDESTLVIENAHVIVGNGEVQRGVVVVIKGERISSIGSGSEVADLMKTRGTIYVPTLTVWQTFGGATRVANPMANLQFLHRQGVRIAVGTDTFGSIEPGVSTIGELELMVEAGLSPSDVLQAATRNAAEHLGLANDLGTVEPGKLADLIIVDGDPIQDISSLHNVKIVVQSGRIVHKVD